MINKVNNVKGFTLIEILMVMIILGILMQMSLTFALDIRRRAFDASALTDGKNLMTMAGNSFIGLDDIDYTHAPADGRNIGDVDTSGALRPPVFTLSSGVKAVISGDSPGIPGLGFVEAWVYHENGTDDFAAFNPDKKREFYFSISEVASTITSPSL